MKILNTTRTLLRDFCEDDLSCLIKLMSDAEVMKYTGFRGPQPIEKIHECLERWIDHHNSTYGVWAAEEIQSKNFIGWFMLRPTLNDIPEIGFMLIRDSWQKGYATEITQGILDYAFSELKLQKVLASTVKENFSSINVLKKVGMRETYLYKSERKEIIYFEKINRDL